jgi:uncharacterized protein
VTVPDVNMLLYAHNTAAPHHAAAREWWRSLLMSAEPVGLAWVAVLGFVRVSTNRKAAQRPLSVEDALRQARGWLDRSNVTILHPGDRHADILFGLLEHVGVAGNLTTDAHLAALAIEYQAELHSTDADFSRFPGLRWRNPLRPGR